VQKEGQVSEEEMDILCPECRKKNLISNRFCFSCGKLLREPCGKKLSYISVKDYIKSLPGSFYYEERMKLHFQSKFILTLIIGLIFVIIFITAGFILILPKILNILWS